MFEGFSKMESVGPIAQNIPRTLQGAGRGRRQAVASAGQPPPSPSAAAKK